MLAFCTLAAMAVALALVFFYAPLDAEQGFLQKIFYVHVPLAIVSLCGFVAGGVLAIAYLRSGDARWDARSYVVSFNRPNLAYRVLPKSSAYEQTLAFIRERSEEAGIVYCASRYFARVIGSASPGKPSSINIFSQ